MFMNVRRCFFSHVSATPYSEKKTVKLYTIYQFFFSLRIICTGFRGTTVKCLYYQKIFFSRIEKKLHTEHEYDNRNRVRERERDCILFCPPPYTRVAYCWMIFLSFFFLTFPARVFSVLFKNIVCDALRFWTCISIWKSRKINSLKIRRRRVVFHFFP